MILRRSLRGGASGVGARLERIVYVDTVSRHGKLDVVDSGVALDLGSGFDDVGLAASGRLIGVAGAGDLRTRATNASGQLASKWKQLGPDGETP